MDYKNKNELIKCIKRKQNDKLVWATVIKHVDLILMGNKPGRKEIHPRISCFGNKSRCRVSLVTGDFFFAILFTPSKFLSITIYY